MKCEKCEFLSHNKGVLRKHIDRVHLKLKKQCSICSWEGAKEYLLRHNKTKHNAILKYNTKFECDICHKEYAEKRGLGVRFSCPSCDLKATTTSNLKVHIRSVHENVKIPCNQCEHQAYAWQNIRTRCTSTWRRTNVVPVL